MIPRDYITTWRAQAPWVQDSQVEQDPVISRALFGGHRPCADEGQELIHSGDVVAFVQ